MNFSPIISVDVEGWAQSHLDQSLPITTVANNNTKRVLDLFDALEVKSTMFVLGKFAKLFPETVRDIAKRGHEIASHGYGHVSVFELSSEEFVEDISTSKKLLEDIVGERVNGYRAPTFSISARNLWAFDEIAKAGFKYDSSVYPIKNHRYGIPEFPKTPVVMNLSEGRSLVEFPLSTFEYRNKAFPVAGGGYHRLLPSFVIQRIVKHILKRRHFFYYCHPYEFNGDEWTSSEFKSLNIEVSRYMKFHQGLGRGSVFQSRFSEMVKKYKPVYNMTELSEMSEDMPRYDINSLTNSY